MARRVSIAAVNFAVRPVADFSEFAAHVRSLLAGCDGADLVLFPELFTTELFTTLPDWRPVTAVGQRRLTGEPVVAWSKSPERAACVVSLTSIR